ncbi:L,D-transpeptidase [Candidatus Woesebacteria bacterium]|nr:L,D-transpeptidase [Candidatus Woesebacteria bacterium]
MQKISPILVIIGLILGGIIFTQIKTNPPTNAGADIPKPSYWFMLHRASNREYLYLGTPGDAEKSELIRRFEVKTGIPGERPTPLPQLVGREYWVLTTKFDSSANPETAPFFLVLDIPIPSEAPFGPSPYLECGGEQCNWVLPGYFGLHGVGGVASRLSAEDEGSSGCIRHSDEDITYLYDLLDPESSEIRYYIEEV